MVQKQPNHVPQFKSNPTLANGNQNVGYLRMCRIVNKDGLISLEDFNTGDVLIQNHEWINFTQPWGNVEDGSFFEPRHWEYEGDTLTRPGDRLLVGFVYDGQRVTPTVIKSMRLKNDALPEDLQLPPTENGRRYVIRKITETAEYNIVDDGKGEVTIDITGKEEGTGNITLTLTGPDADTHGNMGLTISGDLAVTIGRGATINITDDATINVSEGNVALNVETGDVTADIGGKLSAKVEKAVDIESATQKVSLKAGQGIDIDAKAAMNIKSTANISISAPSIKVGPLTLSG